MTQVSPTPTNKTPSHVVYHVRDREGGKSYWTRIGVAWPHSDSAGFNVEVDVVPLSGRLSLRVATEKQD